MADECLADEIDAVVGVHADTDVAREHWNISAKDLARVRLVAGLTVTGYHNSLGMAEVPITPGILAKVVLGASG